MALDLMGVAFFEFPFINVRPVRCRQYALKRQDMPTLQGLANLPLMLKASEDRQK